MASRIYLAAFSHVQLGILTTASSSRVIAPAICRRTYASAAAVATNKNRPPATARKTASTEHLSSASSPKVSVKTASRTHVSAGGPAAKAVSKNARPNAATTKPVAQEKPKVLTEQEQMAQLDHILAFAQHVPTTDVWGQKTETLDVMIPHNVIESRHQTRSYKRMWDQFCQNRLNGIKNMVSMVQLATHNAIPGLSTANDRFYHKLFKWPVRVFSATSVSPTSWLVVMRRQLLEIYKDLHDAIAKNDTKEIKRLASDSFLADILATQKKHNPKLIYIWHLHKEVNPTQILSIRVIEGYLAPEEPKFGNRLMVHALVKFDTEQSLEIYDRQGHALHIKPQGSEELIKGPVPAEKQHVVQYLVLEKRMWYDGPWTIREQIWDVKPKNAD